MTTALREEVGTNDILREIAELKRVVENLAIDRRPEWYTIQQVADARGTSERTIQRYIKDGKLKVTIRGRKRMVHRDDV